LFGQIASSRVQEFAAANRTYSVRLESHQGNRSSISISVNEFDFIRCPVPVHMNDGTNIT
jgi:hypothetical protein